jgi:NADH-quinone oxidoreductase subunit K
MIIVYGSVFVALFSFIIGIAIIISKRTLIMILIGAEFTLNSVNLLFIAFSKLNSNTSGQIFVIFTLTVAAIEIAVGLSIAVLLYRKHKIKSIEDLKELKK